VAAPAIADGELVQQVGGGVSQFSTTLFNATWFSGLPTLKHQPHSKYISRYPPGREATLDYDTIDQVFKNDTAAPVVIRTTTTDTSVTVALYGHTGARTVTSTTGVRLPRNGGGFSISVQRQVRQGGRVIGTDTVRWTYTGFD
jgi:vancomycin resistance protein YoaR